MSEPITFIAQIWINKARYQKFFRTKALTHLAEEIIESQELQLKNAYYWRYSKTKHYLSVKAYYHYGSSHWAQYAFYHTLQQVSTILNVDDHGFLSIINENENADLVEQIFEIKQQKWSKVTHLSKKYVDHFKKISKNTDKFIQRIDIDDVFSLQKLDANFQTKIQRILENKRLTQLKEIAKIASPQQPQFLFGSFYHNGQFVFSTDTGGVIYPEIDIETFRQRPYGASDQHHVIVNHRLRRTAPKKFKKLFKNGQTFYKNEHFVFDEHFNIFHQADPNSFAILNESTCEDEHFFYIGAYQLDKKSSTPIFIGVDHDALFRFENKVIYKTTVLNINDASYQFIQEIPKSSYANNRFILQDQAGYLIVCQYYDQIDQFRENQLNLTQILQKYDYSNSFKEVSKLPNMDWDDREFHDELFNFEHFSHAIQHHDIDVNTALDKYHVFLDFCIYNIKNQILNLKDHDLNIKIYHLLKSRLWINANIYLQLCEYYLHMQHADTAFEFLQYCTTFSCENLLDFLESPLLRPYRDRKDFQDIYQFTQQYIQNSPQRVLSISVLDQALMTTNPHILWVLAKNYVLYPQDVFVQISIDQEQTKLEYIEKYQKFMLLHFKDNYYLIYPTSHFFIDYFMTPIEIIIKNLQHNLKLASIMGNLPHHIENLSQKCTTLQHRVDFMRKLKQQPNIQQINQWAVLQILDFSVH